jgi:hypothetical protein
MNVRSLLIANAQPPELIQPSERPFHHPSPSTESTAVFCVALRKKRDDASLTKTLPDRFGIISHGRPTRSRDDGAVVRVLPAKAGWHPRARGLAVSRYDWPP